MELTTFLLLAGAFACPIMMGAMMWLMSKNMGGRSGQLMPDPHSLANSTERLAALRAQQQALEAEIAEVTRLAELEAQREALLNGETASASKTSASAVQSIDRSGKGRQSKYLWKNSSANIMPVMKGF